MGKGEHLGEFEQLVLLAVLRQKGNGYGVTIRQEIEERTGRTVSIGPIYSTLSRLDEKGYLRSWTGDPTAIRGGRATRHFEITPAGIEALEKSKRMQEKMWEGLDLEWEAN